MFLPEGPTSAPGAPGVAIGPRPGRVYGFASKISRAMFAADIEAGQPA
jgi:hypothetical protein